MAEWEKHTKGIGSKLLMKMGWKPGEGIGTEGRQGISEPIEVELRSRGTGIGFGEQKRSTQKPTENQEPKPVQREARWKKRRKPELKLEYKTVDEIMAAPETPILDMRAPVSTEDHEVSERPLAEIRHNVELIAERTSKLLSLMSQSVANDTKLLEGAQLKMAKIEAEMEQLPVELDKLRVAENVLIEFQQKARIDNISASENRDLVAILHSLSPMDADLVKDGIVAVLIPVLQTQFRQWDPSVLPALCVDVFYSWKSHLTSQQTSSKELSAYETMMYHVWFPPIRVYVQQQWDPLASEPLINVLDMWNECIPVFLLDTIHQQLVYPRLSKALERMSNIESIHRWMTPWAMRLDMTELVPTIRHKLTSAINTSALSNANAHAILLKLNKTILTPKDTSTIIQRSILPTLTHMLSTFVIDPRNPSIAELEVFMQWIDLIPSRIFDSILEYFVLHKWLHTLFIWLTHSSQNDSDDSDGVNLDQVQLWYAQWKDFFRPVAHLACVKNTLKTGLEMMHTHLGHGSSGVKARFGLYAHIKPSHTFTLPTPTALDPSSTSSTSTRLGTRQHDVDTKVTFKQTIEYFAAKNGVEFKPSGKTDSKTQRPLYWFGKVLVYFDAGVVYAQVDVMGGFVPVSFDKLLEMQR